MPLPKRVPKTYEVMPLSNNWVSGLEKLSKACAEEPYSPHPIVLLSEMLCLYRPLTLRENLMARVEDFYTLKDYSGKKRTQKERLCLFDTSVDTFTSILFERQKGQLFKKTERNSFILIPLDQLLMLEIRDAGEEDQPKFYPGVNTRLSLRGGKYNQPLNQEEVPVHPGWLAGVEGDRALLHEVSQLTFYLMMKHHGLSLGMGIYLPADQFFPYQKQVLRLGHLGGGSNVYSGSYRSKKDVCAPFIRVTNQTKIRPAKRRK